MKSYKSITIGGIIGALIVIPLGLYFLDTPIIGIMTLVFWALYFLIFYTIDDLLKGVKE